MSAVVGFDFGTESCIIGVCRRGAIDVLQNEVGNRKTASMVAFSGNQRFIGDSAATQAGSNWKNTIKGFKNLLRVNRLDHPDMKREKQFLPFKLVDCNGKVGVEVRYSWKREKFTPQQITGAMLTQLKACAEAGLRTRVSECVISVPPTWPEEARWALLDASRIAGLNVLRLMNESTAVAVTYGLLRPLPSEPIHVLFCDIGASHTNVFIVEFQAGKLKVLAVDSDYALGGRDFNQVLFEHFRAHILRTYRMDVSTNPKASFKLMKECDKIKMKLSANTIVPFGIEYLMNDTDVKGQVTRQEFEELCAPLVGRLAPLLERVVAKSGVSKDNICSLEVVGGGVRVPMLQRVLREWFGKPLSRTCDGDEAVARGCALQCAMLSPTVKVKDFSVVDMQPYDIQVEWGAIQSSNNSMDSLECLDAPLFASKDPIPCVKLVSFTDRKEPFQIVAGYANPESLPAGTNSRIAQFVIEGFPTVDELIDPHPRIKVEFNLNLHGIFTVVKAVLLQKQPVVEEKQPEPMETDEGKKTQEGKQSEQKSENMDTSEAPEKKTKKRKKRTALTFTSTTCGFDKKTIDLFFERECQMNNQDRVNRETSQARDFLERYVLEMKGRVEKKDDLANYITPDEKRVFLQKLAEEDDWLMSDEGYDANMSEYKKKLAALMKIGTPVTKRQFEHRQRDGSVAILKKMITHYQVFAETTDDEKYAHISAEQRAQVLQKANEVDDWLLDELTKQERLPVNVNPTLTKAKLIAKAKELDGACKPIKNTPKPAPPPEEKKQEEKQAEKAADTPADQEPQQEAPQPEAPQPMQE